MTNVSAYENKVAAMAPVTRLSPSAAMVMLCLVGVAYATNAMDRIVFSILLPNVNKEYGFSLEQGGFLATVFTLGLGIAGIPTGYLLDRFSRKSVILVGMLIYSVLTVLSALAVGFLDLAAYRALSGIGEGMQNAAIFTAVGAYFVANRAAALGAMNFAYGIGSFIGPSLAAYILIWTSDWRAPLVVYGVIGLIVMVIAWLTVSRSFTEQRVEPVDVALSAIDERIPASVVNRNVLICALCAIGLGAGFGYIGLYPTFLRTELHFGVAETGMVMSMFGLGALFGIPAGYLADRFSQRMIGIAALCVIVVNNYVMFNVATSPLAQAVSSLIAGAAGSGFVYVNTYSLIQRCVRPEFTGRASGIMVTCVYLPASVAGYVFATLRTHYGWGNAASLQLCLFLLIPLVAMFFLNSDAIRRSTAS